jgi:hypothetical protein
LVDWVGIACRVGAWFARAAVGVDPPVPGDVRAGGLGVVDVVGGVEPPLGVGLALRDWPPPVDGEVDADPVGVVGADDVEMPAVGVVFAAALWRQG